MSGAVVTSEHNEPRAIGASDRDLVAGQPVGEYVIESKLGQGGFGTVFKATHPLIGKVVAIKVLNRQYSAQPEMVSRFVAEARAVNQIRNRFIIDIFGFGQLDDGRHYYVMEYLDGAPLDDYLDRNGHLPLGDAIPILRAVARALDAAHAKGIAHRDLKPENVFLVSESDGTLYPKLLDFGIAKLLVADDQLKHKTRTGAPIGTPYYMSPEQCRGRDVDHRTDVYAFGCVTFKLLTGVVPFDGEDYMEILIKQMNDAVPSASARIPELPASIDGVIAWMMAKDPAQRPASVVAAVRALEDAAVAAGVVLPPITAPLGSMALGGGRTPSGVLPIGRTPAGMTPADVAGAATLDASLTGPGAVPAASRTAPPVEAPVGAPRRRVWMFLAAAIVPVAAVVVAFSVLANKKDTPGAPAKEIAASSTTATPTSPRTATPEVRTPDPTPTPTPNPTPTPTPTPMVAITLTGVPEGTEVIDPDGHVLTTSRGGDTVIQLPAGSTELKIALHHPDLGDGYMMVMPAAGEKMAMTELARPTLATPGTGHSGRGKKTGKGKDKDGKDAQVDKGSDHGDKPPGGDDSNSILKPTF